MYILKEDVDTAMLQKRIEPKKTDPVYPLDEKGCKF